jgi:hypothetical protein
MQVDSVEMSKDKKRKGFGYLLYLSLVKKGITLISDNFQYLGGQALWKKMARLSGVDYTVYLIDDGEVRTGPDGKPLEYNGSNIDDDAIWAEQPSIKKHFTLLVAKSK